MGREWFQIISAFLTSALKIICGSSQVSSETSASVVLPREPQLYWVTLALGSWLFPPSSLSLPERASGFILALISGLSCCPLGFCLPVTCVTEFSMLYR